MSTLSEKPGDSSDPQTLLMLITVVASGGSEEACVRLLATGIPALISSRRCWIALRSQPANTWHLVMDHQGQLLSATEMAELESELNPLYDATINEGGNLHVTDKANADLHIPSFVSEFGCKQLVAFPLATMRNQLGLLILEGACLSPGETATLETLCQHFSIAVENFRLSDSLERSNLNLQQLVEERTSQLQYSEERQRVLLEINNAIVANLGRGPLFNAVAMSLENVIPYDRVSLVLQEPEKGQIKVYGLAGNATKEFAPVGSVLPSGAGYVETAMERKEPHVRGDLLVGGRTPIEDSLINDGHRSYILVPLISQTSVLGTLNLASNNPNQYSENDGEFLKEVGKQVALAIENMLAFERIDELQRQLALENEYLREQDSSAGGFGEIVGDSPALRQVLEQVELVAPTDANVIVLGESGTGKELIARALHDRSNRKKGPLIRVNCAAIPHELFESEFFGHVKGSFTGASRDRAGRFELANGGTLFLDEVGEIPLDMQSKLLRVLQEGTYERIGDEKTRTTDVRIVAATNRDLQSEVQAKRFRQDLFYRLSVFPIVVVPLRDRKDDIPKLVSHFLDQCSRKMGIETRKLKQRHIIELQHYSWPGNIRELQNVVERAVICSRSGTLEFHLPQPGGSSEANFEPDATDDKELLTSAEFKNLERNNLIAVLENANWKISGTGGAAEFLGVAPATLNSRMRAMGVERPK